MCGGQMHQQAMEDENAEAKLSHKKKRLLQRAVKANNSGTKQLLGR